MVCADGPPQEVAWVRNVWKNPETKPIASIGDAVKTLRAVQRNWALFPLEHRRRCALVEEQLPKVIARPFVFGSTLPTQPMGSWTLLEKDLLLYASECSSPFPNGELVFEEDRESPPNRAYLKLWELFTLIGARPDSKSRCVDLGSSPGGWTWVLQKLGARVIGVDRAPFDPKIAALPGVEWRKGDAFSVSPEDVGPVDWMFSDVIAEPKRSLELAKKWLAAENSPNLVITIKFRGPADPAVARAFRELCSGGTLMHLCHHKNELVFVRLRSP